MSSSDGLICVWDLDETIIETDKAINKAREKGLMEGPSSIKEEGSWRWAQDYPPEEILESYISSKAVRFLKQMVKLRKLGVVSQIILLTNNSSLGLIEGVSNILDSMIGESVFDYKMSARHSLRKRGGFLVIKTIYDVANAMLKNGRNLDQSELEAAYKDGGLFSQPMNPTEKSVLDEYIRDNKLKRRILFFDDNNNHPLIRDIDCTNYLQFDISTDKMTLQDKTIYCKKLKNNSIYETLSATEKYLEDAICPKKEHRKGGRRRSTKRRRHRNYSMKKQK
jgi:hypothetical protein